MESYRDKRLKGYQKNALKKDCGSIRIEEEERRGIDMILFSLKRKREKKIYICTEGERKISQYRNILLQQLGLLLGHV